MDKISDINQYRNLPELRKKAPDEKVMKIEFRIVTEPTFDEETGQQTSPPHWEILNNEVKMGWGPMETAQMMWHWFCIATVAQQIIPRDVLEQALDALNKQQLPGGMPA